MQNKGLIWTFIVLLTLACLYQLSFTWVAASVESDAEAFANGDSQLKERYLDSISTSGESVYPILGFTYKDVQKQQLNLGLDLKGGMNVTLEVSVADVIKALASTNANDPVFQQVIASAKEKQKNAQEGFVVLFGQAWEEVAGDKLMTSIFYNIDNKDNLNPVDTNEEVLTFLEGEAEAAFERTFEVLRTRVNLFGVAQPNIQKLAGADRILVELPGVKNKERVRKLLQGTAKLQFWETYDYEEIYQDIEAVNGKLNLLLNGVDSTALAADTLSADSLVAEEPVATEPDTTLIAEDSTANDTTEEKSLAELIADEDGGDLLGSGDSTAFDDADLAQRRKDNPLYAVMQAAVYQDPNSGQVRFREGPTVGYVSIKDTAKVNEYLAMPEVKSLLPAKLKLLWTAKPYDDNGEFLELIAIKVRSLNGEAELEGDVITDAYQDFSQFGGRPEITMKMNTVGANKWKLLTGDNVGKSIAIVLDDYVYSYPNVNGEISGGISSIEGNFDIEEAKLLANILKAGKLPAPAKIVEEAVVGPSLGAEAISSGLTSFLIALVIVLLYMIFYYGKAGIASDLALLANLFFIMGVLASTNIALTLPGIAGIVLTIGISVDANVLIYERIREELAAGKGTRLAVADGYKQAYSSIIDANVTTLLTGIILWFFGTGPVEGFAKTLVIGILTSLFSAIFITRLIFAWRMNNKKKITVATKMTEGAFKNTAIPFVAKRKMYYVISSIIILLGVGSFVTRGLSYGVDFTGGRTYTVRFTGVDAVSNADVRNALTVQFGAAPEVKTFGDDNQVRITTNHLINSEDENADNEVESKLNEGLKTLNLEYEQMSSQKVGPTIADDIKKNAVLAIGFSLLIIFLYILFRFRKWQYGLGAVVAIFHDVLVVLSVFSLLHGILPFSLEIDQAFIAAILTVVGYSINDTVVVFDRIREYLGLYKKREMNEVINDALNSTLSRTVNTSLSTIFVLLMIFLFGGEVIRGFAFALLVGVMVGTYSSLCVASPIVIDLASKEEGKKK